jgi:ElaB/YqjD/DUF883 family membrane-anchored ribosome-binding protein
MPRVSDCREAAMEKTPIEIGYPPASQPTPDEIREANRNIHQPGRVIDAAQAEVVRAFRNAAVTVQRGVQDGADEVIAYTRREPAAALTMAAGLGILVGFVMAIGSFGGRGWLAPRRPSVMTRLTGLRWTGLRG